MPREYQFSGHFLLAGHFTVAFVFARNFVELNEVELNLVRIQLVVRCQPDVASLMF
jgi:hypothetical protein